MATEGRKTGLGLLRSLRGALRARHIRSFAAIVAKALFLFFSAVGCTHQQLPVSRSVQQPALPVQPDLAISKQADFKQEKASKNARRMADWVVDSRDSNGMPFVIIDKVDAKAFVFDADGRLRGAAPVLLGLAQGDDAAPGIGNRKLSEIPAEERTTPAGRFPALLGYNLSGKDILWVDYDNAISLHRVITTNPKEHRLERLASPKPLEHRISFGCINVPATFFDDCVKPTFTGKMGIVYVLPETRSNGEVFHAYYDVESRCRKDAALDLNEEPRAVSRRSELNAP